MRIFHFQIPIGASLSLLSGIVSATTIADNRDVTVWLFWVICFGLSLLLLVSGIKNMVYVKNLKMDVTNLDPDKAIDKN